MKTILALLLSLLTAQAASVTLTWDANTETNLAGYRIYTGTASRIYGVPVTTTNTTITLTNLASGTNYFFAATAVLVEGLESEYSDELSYTTPAKPAPPRSFRITTTLQTASTPNGPWTNNVELSQLLPIPDAGTAFYRSQILISSEQ